MYEFQYMLFTLGFCGVVLVLGIIDTNLRVCTAAVVLAAIVIVLGLFVVSVPHGMLAGIPSSEYTLEPGLHFKMPWEPIVYVKTEQQEYEITVYAVAKDGVEVEHHVSFWYDVVKPWVIGSFVTTYGTDYMNVTFGAYIQSELRNMTQELTSREWYSHNNLKDVQPNLNKVIGKALEYNGLRLDPTGIGVTTYVVDKDLYKKYANEWDRSHFSDLYSRSDSVQHNYSTL